LDVSTTMTRAVLDRSVLLANLGLDS
jgi:hypothetical protein